MFLQWQEHVLGLNFFFKGLIHERRVLWGKRRIWSLRDYVLCSVKKILLKYIQNASFTRKTKAPPCLFVLPTLFALKLASIPLDINIMHWEKIALASTLTFYQLLLLIISFYDHKFTLWKALLRRTLRSALFVGKPILIICKITW